ncbi:protein Mdm4 isoform X3 [Xyrauchen texanus]|uniref:protein Mdm4 isoform X3 n=1 Tax=Xyrauchen texanus TaxID=154827 RepID=UPI00224243D7|nr:protein Mdm4 isoform X3 [Xyrauchen texanus]
MTSLSSSSQLMGSSSTCRALPGEGSQVHPKAPLLQILRVAGAQEEVFTLKEVMHYLGQYIMMKQLYDKQRQHIVHCQDDPLGELLEVGSFSVKNPSPVYEMLKRNLFTLNSPAPFHFEVCMLECDVCAIVCMFNKYVFPLTL